MPTAVEYDPEKGGMVDGSVRKGDGSVRWGLLLPAVFVLIIAVCLLFLPGQTLLSFFGCPSGPAGGEHVESFSFGDSARGGFLGTLNMLRVAVGGQNNAVPPDPCFVPLTAPPPLPGVVDNSLPGTPEPLTEPPPTSTPVGNGGLKPPNPVVGLACTPNPGDGICSACENTDIDSASCVCNMNGVCDPQEGFNCPDCQPTAVPGQKPGSKNGNKSCVPSAAGVPCR